MRDRDGERDDVIVKANHTNIGIEESCTVAMAINVIARIYGNMEPISMAKSRTKKEQESAENGMITNTTAGMPGVATVVANKRIRQTILFRRCRHGRYIFTNNAISLSCINVS